MQAIILAAGVGSRLQTVSQGRPKCLVPVAGKPILSRQVDALEQVGIKDIVVVTGHKASLVREAVKGRGVRFVHNPRFAETNVLASWYAGSAELNDDHFYLHGDTVFEVEVLNRALQVGRAIVLTVDRHPCAEEEMKVQILGERVVDINKEMPSEMAAGEFTGVMFASRESLEPFRRSAGRLLAGGGDRLFFESILRDLIRTSGHEVSWTDVTGLKWREIDFPEDLAAAEEMFTAPARGHAP